MIATGEAKQRSRGSVPTSVRRRGAVLMGLLAAIMALSPALGLAQEAPPPADPKPAEAAAPAVPAAPAADVPQADAAKAEAPDPNRVVIPIVLARELRDEPLPLSLLDLPPKDLGIAGAKLAITDNNTTGRFMNQEFKLDPIEEADPAKLIQDVVQKVDAGDALHHRRCPARYAAEDGRRPQGQGGAPHQLQRARRQLARGRLPRPTCCTPRRPARCWPTRSPNISSGRSGRTGCWCSAPAGRTSFSPTPIRRAAKKFGGKIVEERDVQATTPAAAAPTAASSRFSSRFRPSCRAQKTTTSSSSPMRAICSPTIFPIAPGMPRPVAGSAGLVAVELAPGAGALGRNAVPESLQAPDRPHHAPNRLRRLGRDARRRRSGFAQANPAISRRSSTSCMSPSFEVAAFKGVASSFRSGTVSCASR